MFYFSYVLIYNCQQFIREHSLKCINEFFSIRGLSRKYPAIVNILRTCTAALM